MVWWSRALQVEQPLSTSQSAVQGCSRLEAVTRHRQMIGIASLRSCRHALKLH